MKAHKAVVLTLLTVAVACATQGQRLDSEPFTTSTERPDSVLLEVQNLNFSDARLYAIRDGRRMTLGRVGGKQDARFTIPWRFSQELRIEINLLAGPTCVTERLQVDRGDILELQISGVFSQSTFCQR
jgi:hypothetical protein